MTVKLGDICNRDKFFALVTEGHIRASKHPILDLTIYKYSKTAPYHFKPTKWPEELMIARGLVLNSDEEVIARGFRKFFNYGEQKPPFAKTNKPIVFEKVDGSCLLVFRYENQYVFATLGSFISDQAQWASEFWKDNYKYHFSHKETFTFIYEIIYPENRIVVNYGDRCDLIWLGYIDPETGEDHDIRRFPSYLPPEKVVKNYEFDSIKEALAWCDEQPAADSEGLILCWFRPGKSAFRLKLKGQDYLKVFKMLYYTSNLTMWEHLMTGRTIADIKAEFPDILHQWIDETCQDLVERFEKTEYLAALELEAVLYMLGEEGIDPDTSDGRKEFAKLVVNRTPRWGFIFMMLDKQDYAIKIWESIRPTYSKPYITSEEE
jgi:RNA ligase